MSYNNFGPPTGGMRGAPPPGGPGYGPPPGGPPGGAPPPGDQVRWRWKEFTGSRLSVISALVYRGGFFPAPESDRR